MSQLVIETRGLCDWRSRLADPEKQWKRGYSAFEAAVAWEKATSDPSGIPLSIVSLLNQQPELANPKLIVGIAEHKVSLPGGKRSSQNDVWALVKVGEDMLSLAIEAKAGESFADLVSVWMAKSEKGSNKPARLEHLLSVLEISGKDVSDVRYQLLHRTASAVMEATRVGAKYAAMIVQSFRNQGRNADPAAQFNDFRICGEKCGALVEENQLVRVPGRVGVPLYLGWVTCEPASDAEIAALA